MLCVCVCVCLSLSLIHPVSHNDPEEKPSDVDVNIKLQKCGAYEVIHLSKQRVVMNDNPTYGEIGQ